MAAAEDPTAKALRVWQHSAPTYDRQLAWFERTQLRGARAWLAARATGRILEVAVGTGLDLPHYPPGADLTGVDLSPAMLAQAADRAVALGRAVDLRVADAERLPFDDGSFDTVVCALGLCTIPDPAAAIGEAHRVLRAGGRLLLLDHIGSTVPPLYALQWLVERVTIVTSGEHFTRRQLPLVRTAGFEVVETDRRRAGVVELVHAMRPGSAVQG